VMMPLETALGTHKDAKTVLASPVEVRG
jgi:hypothetical protein